VKALKKLETREHVVHVGHLELFQLCLIDCVSPQSKLIKPEYQLRIFYHVVHRVVVDVKVVILQLHGHILPGRVS